jgi:secreted trypsin-like serine protease
MTNGYGDYPNRLQEVEVSLLDAAECDYDPSKAFCAGDEGLDSCYGDSGGPIVITTRRGDLRLAGVVSEANTPDGCGFYEGGAYTSVPHYAGWINAWRKSPNKPRSPEEVPPSE